jgi:hypothetical protein
MAQQVMAINNAGNNGSFQNNNFITREELQARLNQIVAIPVVASEYRTSLAQRNVGVREGHFSV